jgi:hypothetical protein
VEIAHLQSDIAQIIGEVFGGPFRQRCHRTRSAFSTAAAKLDRVVDLILERLERDLWIEQARSAE